MGHQAIIFGRIQEDWEGNRARWPATPEYNDGVLESLPNEDNHWPFLTRHMFAVAQRAFHGNGDRGEYRGRVIHFAASLKDDPAHCDWPMAFLSKLEQIVLRRLLWKSARVHFESTFFAERVFVYQSDPGSIAALHNEIALNRFGERIESESIWERLEVPGAEGRIHWLW
jgi:hypothetical protein